MTAQFQEGLRFRGKEYGMAACPLEQAFDAGVERPPFAWQNTACWRGYVGSWEVRDDRLYLTALEGRVAATREPEVRLTREFGLADLFPDPPPGGVFAEWVTDWLRATDGELLRYVHMGFASTFERDVHLAVHRGRLVAMTVVDNRTRTARPTELAPLLDAVYGDESGFLRALHQPGNARLTRLVYADWLDERGDPRGELLRLDVELEDAAGDESRTRLHTVARERLLGTVKDWFWMKLVGSPLPTTDYGAERRGW